MRLFENKGESDGMGHAKRNESYCAGCSVRFFQNIVGHTVLATIVVLLLASFKGTDPYKRRM